MELFIKLDIQSLQDGIIRKVGGVKQFAIISSIAAFMNKEGVAFPSQERIAEMTGYSRKTINETMKELRMTKIDGENIIEIKQVKASTGRRNVYKLSPKLGFKFGRDDVTNSNDDVTNQDAKKSKRLHELEPSINKNHLEQEPKDIVFDTARNVLDLFRQRYFETYNVAYKPNWAKDQATIKNQIMPTYTDEQIVQIIETVFEHYDDKWGNDKFPRPSIGQISSWLGNKALAMSQDKQQASKKVDEDAERYNYDDSYFTKLLDEL